MYFGELYLLHFDDRNIMLGLRNRQTILPHTFNMEFDRFLNKFLDTLASICDSDAPGQVWNAGAPRGRTLFEQNGVFHLSLHFQSSPAWR